MAENSTYSYPLDQWKIIENEFNQERIPASETIFSLGNGFIGLRGNFEESNCFYYNGTYLNGFYDSEPIVYGEIAYGYAKSRQTMLNVTDAKIIRLYLDGEPFDLRTGKISRYRRTLDTKKGILTRNLRWQSPEGREIELNITRLVCFAHRQLAAIRYQVKAINQDMKVTLCSIINGKVRNQKNNKDPRIGSTLSKDSLLIREGGIDSTFAFLAHTTRNTGLSLVCAMENYLESDCPYTVKSENLEFLKSVNFHFTLKQGEDAKLFKYIAYYTSLDHPESRIQALARKEVTKARQNGFDTLMESQREYLGNFWKRSDVQIEGDIALQQSLRFNLFHLLQAVGRDGHTSISAKGLTGEGYEGHYFWETEIYILPVFLYTMPHIAEKLLEYRYKILDRARARAAEMAQAGALYAWRTIDGEETSAYYPAGTAQYHINADIAFAIKKYTEVSGNINFLKKSGAEMLIETARLWADLGDFIAEKNNRFCINGVTGPDEYTFIVNNNTYTNLMARDHLEYAVRVVRFLKRYFPKIFRQLQKKTALRKEEIDQWEKAASLMYVPFNQERGIHCQDDSFLNKAIWDFDTKPPDKYPLLLHYHPLVINRYQVLKQPDLVLALFLQGNRFSLAQKKRNFDYYDPLTTGDSSLAPCIQGIISSEVGYHDKAYHYFRKTARMDLDDINGNVKHGIHTASMAGSWLSLVYGFAGMRDYGGSISFKPRLPLQWKRLKFNLIIRKSLISVDLGRDAITYLLVSGSPTSIKHENTTILLTRGKTTVCSLMAELRGIIFDLDGVITDTAKYHFLAWKRLAEKIGLTLSQSYNQHLKGLGRMESLELILKQGSISYSRQEKEALALRKNQYYRQMIRNITPDDLLPGIPALLKELEEAGIKVALASSSRNALQIIKALGIESSFHAYVDPQNVVKGKPDPEIFIQAASLLDLAPRDCIGIEDAQAGIDSIKAAGMYAVGVGKELNNADWLIDDTALLTWKSLKKRFTDSL